MYSTCRQLFYAAVKFYKDYSNFDCSAQSVVNCHIFSWLFKGRMWGMLTGLGCGLLLDSFSGGVLGYYTLIFIYIGYFNGIFTRVLAHDMVVMPVLLCSANELIYSVYIYVFSFLLFGRVNIADYIKNLALPELLITAIATIIAYGVIMTVDRHLTEAEKKGEKRFA